MLYMGIKLGGTHVNIHSHRKQDEALKRLKMGNDVSFKNI